MATSGDLFDEANAADSAVVAGHASGAAWAVRRSARARRLAIRVYPEGRVEIVVPRGASAATVQSFVARHRDWVDRKLAERRSLAPAVAEVFPPTELRLAAFGERWTLRQTPGLRAIRVVTAGHDTDESRALLLPQSATPAGVQKSLLQWLGEHARREFTTRLSTLSRETGLLPSALQVRRQRTRWGSCSRRGVISLNLCGAFQRPEVLRYLMLHELVHLRHMNHSAAYWRAVEDLCPDWRTLDRELTRGWRYVPRWVFGA